MIRIITTAMLSTALALASAAASAEENQQVSASRSQVEAACDANGGFAWGTGAAGGRYGCITDNAWIECDGQGDCEGGRAARKTPVRRSGAPGQSMHF